ncbi:MAG: hypothetical protein A3F17_05395 [Gammaproteobacteria bacterium RIFCSPHIGHO2_12_FULL_41_15]|nr:MAG: hypothetical protein A3F17_05395 [Gammaproteobacteria bacterium RIFCSPHIGHO2_12_FULL_41_15]
MKDLQRKWCKGLWGIVIVAAMMGLSACAGKIHYTVVPKTPAQIRAEYLNELRSDGVQVISLGETLRFVLSSDDLFNPGSANLKAGATGTLQTLARLVSTYDKVNIRIAAYTDNVGNAEQQRALTTRQAEVVSSFLWVQGIEARLEYAVGLGRAEPIASNSTSAGRHDNRRVEISFRYYLPTPYF